MNEDEVSQYITSTFEDVETTTAYGAIFFFYDPNHMFPFATITATDENDQFSNLDRPLIFRLNIGVSKQTYLALFGSPVASTDLEGSESDLTRQYDFTALDRLMPHPVYNRQYWVCILNPSSNTFQEVVQPLLAEAYEMDVRKHSKKRAATTDTSL